jgi:hypothetical protein
MCIHSCTSAECAKKAKNQKNLSGRKTPNAVPEYRLRSINEGRCQGEKRRFSLPKQMALDVPRSSFFPPLWSHMKSVTTTILRPASYCCSLTDHKELLQIISVRADLAVG